MAQSLLISNLLALKLLKSSVQLVERVFLVSHCIPSGLSRLHVPTSTTRQGAPSIAAELVQALDLKLRPNRIRGQRQQVKRLLLLFGPVVHHANL
jgi:hypothetical protein